MKIALLSDIHGNREAFDACLAHAGRRGAERYVFLGDLVGYGADPCYVVERVERMTADAGAIAVLGNHDEAAVTGDFSGMNDYARKALAWTHRTLNQAQRDFLMTLPRYLEEDDRLYVHSEASAPNDWRYVVQVADAERSMRATGRRLTFCGHVHQPRMFHMNVNRPAASFTPTAKTPVPLLRTRRWLIVLPSVGQPRDENPAAGYGILDTDRNEFTIWRKSYNIEAAAEKIHAAGLPRVLAARLYVGR